MVEEEDGPCGAVVVAGVVDRCGGGGVVGVRKFVVPLRVTEVQLPLFCACVSCLAMRGKGNIFCKQGYNSLFLL
jgi:hypothetical protein